MNYFSYKHKILLSCGHQSTIILSEGMSVNEGLKRIREASEKICPECKKREMFATAFREARKAGWPEFHEWSKSQRAKATLLRYQYFCKLKEMLADEYKDAPEKTQLYHRIIKDSLEELPKIDDVRRILQVKDLKYSFWLKMQNFSERMYDNKGIW